MAKGKNGRIILPITCNERQVFVAIVAGIQKTFDQQPVASDLRF